MIYTDEKGRLHNDITITTAPTEPYLTVATTAPLTVDNRLVTGHWWVDHPEPKKELTPMICKQCGGKIKEDMVCESCGTRYEWR